MITFKQLVCNHLLNSPIHYCQILAILINLTLMLIRSPDQHLITSPLHAIFTLLSKLIIKDVMIILFRDVDGYYYKVGQLFLSGVFLTLYC